MGLVAYIHEQGIDGSSSVTILIPHMGCTNKPGSMALRRLSHAQSFHATKFTHSSEAEKSTATSKLLRCLPSDCHQRDVAAALDVLSQDFDVVIWIFALALDSLSLNAVLHLRGKLKDIEICSRSTWTHSRRAVASQLTIHKIMRPSHLIWRASTSIDRRGRFGKSR